MLIQMSRSALAVAVCIALLSSGSFGAGDASDDSEGIFSGATFSRSSLSTIWKLDESEIKKYEQLEIEERVYSDPGTVQSPYAVLGKHARTTSEREKYAELERKKMQEHTIKALLWVLASQEVAGYNDLSPAAANAKKALEVYDTIPEIREAFAKEGIGRSGFVAALHESYGMSGHDDEASSAVIDRSRVVFFAPIDDCGAESECISILRSLQSKQVVGDVEMIDVVAIGANGNAPSDLEIVEWANAYEVVTKDTINKSVTLQAVNDDSRALLNGRDAPVGVLLDGTVYQ